MKSTTNNIVGSSPSQDLPSHSGLKSEKENCVQCVFENIFVNSFDFLYLYLYPTHILIRYILKKIWIPVKFFMPEFGFAHATYALLFQILVHCAFSTLVTTTTRFQAKNGGQTMFVKALGCCHSCVS